MNSIFGLMATSGGNFVSIAHLEIPLLIKMLMCQILIFPAVYTKKTAIFVTLDHKTSHKSLGYICSNSQKYIVWVKIVNFYFRTKIIRILSKNYVP